MIQAERTGWFATTCGVLAMAQFAVACAGATGTGPGPAPTEPGAPVAAEDGAPGAGEATSGAEGAGEGRAPAEARSASVALAARPAPIDGRAADPAAGLPEVSIRHIGLHVGGGPNDDATRKPILRAVEGHFTRFLRCYTLVDRPLVGGVYGLDLHVPAAGGRAEVKATRQKLGSPEFDGCMVEAFRQVRFPRPPRPTVVSYSLRFDVTDPTAR